MSDYIPILKSTSPSANGRVVDNHERLHNLIAQGHNPITLAARYTNKDHFIFPDVPDDLPYI